MRSLAVPTAGCDGATLNWLADAPQLLPQILGLLSFLISPSSVKTVTRTLACSPGLCRVSSSTRCSLRRPARALGFRLDIFVLPTNKGQHYLQRRLYIPFRDGGPRSVLLLPFVPCTVECGILNRPFLCLLAFLLGSQLYEPLYLLDKTHQFTR
ncbi:hypothetical protein M404DRAFT_477261 [Pisolithus tinctorius Marx 270]|uniref:Uncharacterized protein n=1 Tax=Pisolithus tinctorius Marx 270 TaxID=870435 RepID=A0A0C3PY19_PISTI|nr:hypothetical protein M404DRAFT_477261 [Pisolithus tinctorius Marx 270]